MAAAYALVLQAFFTYSIASAAAAQDGGAEGGAFFVLCLSHDDGAAPAADAPVKPNTHCPICTPAGSGGLALLPEPIAVPAPHDALTRRTAFVTADACLSFHRARANLSRAPPHNA